MTKLYYIIVVFASIALIYGGFIAKRWFNYKFSYQSQVEESVSKLVKEECLR